MAEKVVSMAYADIATEEFDQSLEIAATVQISKGGIYHVHIEELNDTISLPFDVVVAIAAWASEVVKKNEQG